MARKKIREFTSKALLKEHLKRLRGIDLPTEAAQVISRALRERYVTSDDLPPARMSNSSPSSLTDQRPVPPATYLLATPGALLPMRRRKLGPRFLLQEATRCFGAWWSPLSRKAAENRAIHSPPPPEGCGSKNERSLGV